MAGMRAGQLAATLVLPGALLVCCSTEESAERSAHDEDGSAAAAAGSGNVGDDAGAALTAGQAGIGADAGSGDVDADQAPEDADPADAILDAAPLRKLVFATESQFAGDFNGQSGLAGGDAICQAAAQEIGLSGTYRAWLSDGTSSPATRFTRSTVPYVTVRGELVASDWNALVSYGPQQFISRRDGAVADSPAWTGTEPDGAPAASHCAGWSSASSGEVGVVGYSYFASDWTHETTLPCASMLALYCFEQ